MGIHEFNEHALPDTEFVDGEIKYIVSNNKCRLLDTRRTPGYIEEYFEDTAMFRWRITDFEDKGNYWDVPAEDIKMFQILKNSIELELEDVDRITMKIKQFNNTISITATKDNKKITEEKITIAEKNIICWFENGVNSAINELRLDLDSKEGNETLIKNLKCFMKSIELDYIEEKTTSEIVLNPNSEWIKGIKIILAELGIVSYKDKILRQTEIFNEVGGKQIVLQYIINRIAYLRAYFRMLNIDEVILYRGMSTAGDWFDYYEKSITSWTFNLDVALSFADLDKSSKGKNCYVLKRSVPVENLFMTYLETEAMNKQYKESEAILFFNNKRGYY